MHVIRLYTVSMMLSNHRWQFTGACSCRQMVVFIVQRDFNSSFEKSLVVSQSQLSVADFASRISVSSSVQSRTVSKGSLSAIAVTCGSVTFAPPTVGSGLQS